MTSPSRDGAKTPRETIADLTCFFAICRATLSGRRAFSRRALNSDDYAVDFHEDRVEISRRDGTLTTTLEVLVSAEDDAEVRRVSISNAGLRARDIEITSYSELALGPQSADVAHPAFAKMFVETEYLAEFGAIVATRRKRNPSEPDIWAAHLSVANGEDVGGPDLRNRQSSLPRPRARCGVANCDAGRAAFNQFGRDRARSDLCLAPTYPYRCGRHGSRRLLDHGCWDPGCALELHR